MLSIAAILIDVLLIFTTLMFQLILGDVLGASGKFLFGSKLELLWKQVRMFIASLTCNAALSRF